ncbi:MAG: ABC transporter permease [Lachnospirales bacterium]
MSHSTIRNIKKYKMIYVLLIPVVLYYVIFKYAPMYGVQLAFKEYRIADGITGSQWIGFENFINLMSQKDFWIALRNTVIISLMKLVIGFPIPVILSIVINEICFVRFKKVAQIVYTFPHFLSWVIISSIMFNLFSSNGAINNLIVLLGGEKYDFLTNTDTFRYLLVFSESWKEAGWATIIYMATIIGIDPSLYEAAKLDGANRFKKIVHIVWPGIKSVIITMFILQVGRTMSAGFMQIFNLYNPTVYSVADILDTYVYRITFETVPNFGFSTAVGLFTGIANLGFLICADKIAKLFGEKGIV